MADLGSTMHFTASSFSSYEEFRDHVVSNIRDATGCPVLVYEDAGQTWVQNVCDHIETQMESRSVRKNYNSLTREFWLQL
ncbi:hypothetical protein FE257_009494 [Aspergillus nanangensis]|uniref:Uncharacterized protein n=1 Tax=Aspergillus nanangensis TaxID=2582783 RepID=A0AAD4GRW7_ASPNN|nr:hypothetical protein FE257_009494 [Aspergillus nanangensis]